MQLTALLALLPVVAALPGSSYGGSDYSSPSASGTTTPAAQQSGTTSAANGVTTITVGKTPLKMEPNDVTVPTGGIIEFVFYSGAHSVAQSAFDSPCTPLNSTSGFFSGSQPVTGQGTGSNVFRVVSTGQPMWYYCATQKHCQGGMVGVINKPATNAARTIEAYTAAAKLAPANIAPQAVQGGTIVAAANSKPAGSAASASVHDLRMVGLAVGVAAIAFAL